jgi:hypothetical protein
MLPDISKLIVLVSESANCAGPYSLGHGRSYESDRERRRHFRRQRNELPPIQTESVRAAEFAFSRPVKVLPAFGYIKSLTVVVMVMRVVVRFPLRAIAELVDEFIALNLSIEDPD